MLAVASAAICGAKTRSGAPCKKHPMPNGRCRLHGGKSLAGIASPTFKTGRYSKYLPNRLAERYQEALADGDLLVLREEIALLDARLADLLKRVDTGESGSLWKRIEAIFTEYQKAKRMKDEDAAAYCIYDLEKAIEKGNADYAAWNEIGSVLEQRRKLVESERKRLVEAQQVITVEKAMGLVAALADIVKRYVTDKDALTGISAELVRLVGTQSRAVVDGE